MQPDDLLFPKLAKRRTWLMVKKDLARVGIKYETPEGIADFHAAGRHTHISGLLKNGASLPETKELARHTDVKMTMKYTHVGMDDRAKAVARLPSQERFRSASAVSDGDSEAPGDTAQAGKEGSQEKTNPGGSRGYVIVCRPTASEDAKGCQWRRRESNPRPETFPRPLLRA
jgi:integrase/recombinase XerD